ncbi:hypothetical protein [Brevibacillus laterosporus]|nr:hypothetical protein [Brevibacillus laterosporus]
MKMTPSPEATKKLICEVIPKIMQDLAKKGKLPSEYLDVKKVC